MSGTASVCRWGDTGWLAGEPTCVPWHKRQHEDRLFAGTSSGSRRPGRVQSDPTAATQKEGDFNQGQPANALPCEQVGHRQFHWRWSSVRWYIEGRTVGIAVQWVDLCYAARTSCSCVTKTSQAISGPPLKTVSCKCSKCDEDKYFPKGYPKSSK